MMPEVFSRNFKFFFAAVVVSISGLIIYRTPFAPPPGFPFAAKPVTPTRLNQEGSVPPVAFVDRTLEKGLHFIHQQGDEQLAGIDETLGSGACAADFNNDGWVDLFLVNGSGHTRYYGKPYWWQKTQGNRLFLNKNGGKFEDATIGSGLGKEVWGMGCLASDFDNDGDTDLLVTGKETVLLYKNNGNGTFADITQESGMKGEFWSTSAAAADFNGDGFLDIYVGNFIHFKKGKKTFEANTQFAGENKHTFDSSLYEAQPNQLYLNLGGFKFKDIAAQAGVNDTDGKTLDTSWQDINDDGRPDLIVTNDRGTGSNTSYLNHEGNRFEPGVQALGLRSALGNRGIASGDLDNDGDMDLVLASPTGENTAALIKGKAFGTDKAASTYYKDKARDMGIGDDQFLNLSAWSTLVQDFNNDGFNDVFIAAGHSDPDPDSAKVTQGQTKQLLLNTGKGTFTDMTATAGIALQDTQSARGAVATDFDNDGDLDLYVAHNNDLGQFLANESPHRHWLGLKLVGTSSNRDAVGATVQLSTQHGGQTRTIVSGEGFLSDSDKRIVFGLGNETQAVQFKVRWPNGNQQTFRPKQIDRYWEVEESRPDIQELPGNKGDEMPEPHLHLKLGADQVGLRVRYLSLLEQSGQRGLIWPELAAASHDGSPQVRLEAIKIASRSHQPETLSLLTRSLEDPDMVNVIAAIEGLRLREDETAIRCLLRLFSHQNPAVKVALADSFAFYFQEEEAVVHRKYLALPYLIRMLEDADPRVRCAAVRALANAERFRGIHALLVHLNDPDASVRAEIVRCLGLIRQTQALPALINLSLDSSQSTRTIANSFIARKRLGDSSALQAVEDFVMGQNGFGIIAQEKRLKVLADIVAQTDEAAVLDWGRLKQIARAAFKQFPPKPGTTSNTFNTVRYWLLIQQYIADPALVGWIGQQTRSPSAEIRALAFQTIYSQKTGDQTTLLRRAWSDQDASIKNWALERSLPENTSLSTEDYRSIADSPEFLATAIRVWQGQGFTGNTTRLVKAWHQLSLAKTGNEKSGLKPDNVLTPPKDSTRKETAEASSRSQLADIEHLCRNAPTKWQAFCPLILFSQNTPEYRSMVLKLLHDPTCPPNIRQTLLERYDTAFDPDAVNVVYALAQTKKDPLGRAALHKIFSFNADALVGFARKKANTASEDPATRFQAVEFLVRKGHPDALDTLYH